MKLANHLEVQNCDVEKLAPKGQLCPITHDQTSLQLRDIYFIAWREHINKMKNRWREDLMM